MTTLKEVEKLADETGELDTEIKKKTKLLNSKKEQLKKESSIFGKINSDESLVIEGNKYDAVIITKSSYQVDVRKTWDLCNKSIGEFFKVVKISISDLKKQVGEEKALKVMEKTKESKSISFKLKEV